MNQRFLYPPLQRSWKGVYWFHLVRPSVRLSIHLSVCGQNCVCSVSSTKLVGSISYVHIFSSNFSRCVACKVRFKIKKFVFFWFGIEYDSIVWVIMRWRGVSSERRCSSCSSCSLFNGCCNIHVTWFVSHCGYNQVSMAVADFLVPIGTRTSAAIMMT